MEGDGYRFGSYDWGSKGFCAFLVATQVERQNKVHGEEASNREW